MIYDKLTGAVVAGPTSLATLGAGNCASGFGRAIVLYDNLADRWLMAELSSLASSLCVYVSQTSDPVGGGWHAYEFATPTFPDYPKFAAWPDAYYVGANETVPSLLALDRTSMLGGLAATSQRFTATPLSAFGFQMLAPVDHDGALPPPAGAPGLFLRHNDDEAHSTPDVAGADSLELFEFHVDWATPANSTLTGPISIAMAEISSDFCGFTSLSCIPQPGAPKLDPLREVVMNKPTYRNQRRPADHRRQPGHQRGRESGDHHQRRRPLVRAAQNHRRLRPAPAGHARQHPLHRRLRLSAALDEQHRDGRRRGNRHRLQLRLGYLEPARPAVFRAPGDRSHRHPAPRRAPAGSPASPPATPTSTATTPS